MTYEVYRYIFIGAAILCAIMFAVSIFLFITLKVPKLISDLSGRTAKKAIKNLREQNEVSGEKFHKVSAFNESRGKLTDKISQSGRIQQKGQSVKFGIGTSKISTQELSYEDQNGDTMVLNDTYGGETSVLDDGNSYETSVLNDETMNGTTVLNNEFASQTTVLDYGTASPDNVFSIEYDITLLHTDEII